MHGCMDVCMYVHIYIWTDGWTDGRMDGRTDGWMDGLEGLDWMDGWIGGIGLDGWMDEWMDMYRTYTYIYTDVGRSHVKNPSPCLLCIKTGFMGICSFATQSLLRSGFILDTVL